MKQERVGPGNRGRLVRDLIKLLRALDSRQALTIKQLSSETRMGLRQVYRWINVLDEENLVECLDSKPGRYRLKPEGSRLRRRVRG